jgi:hypothetical protein
MHIFLDRLFGMLLALRYLITSVIRDLLLDAIHDLHERINILFATWHRRPSAASDEAGCRLFTSRRGARRRRGINGG